MNVSEQLKIRNTKKRFYTNNVSIKSSWDDCMKCVRLYVSVCLFVHLKLF